MDLENISRDYGEFYELLRDEVALQKTVKCAKKKKPAEIQRVFQVLWELLDSNQRPPPCKGDALNQLS